MSGPNTQRDEETIDIIGYYNILLSNRRLIGIFVTAVFAISVAVSLFLPKVYAATASVFPPQQENMLNPGAVISSQTPAGFGGAAGFLGIKSPADLWVGILRSATVQDAILKRFDLKERYRAVTVDGARRSLSSRVTITKNKEEIVSITFEDKDPDTAARIANAFVEELDSVNKNVAMTSGKRMRVFVEKRIELAKTDLKKSEDALKSFQEKNKAFSLDVQAKAIIESIGALKGMLVAKEVELETLLSYATSTNPKVELIRSEIRALKDKLKRLEKGGYGLPMDSAEKNVFIPTDRIPAVLTQYLRLLRDVKAQETLYQLLSQQYEMAMIQEAKDSPTVQVLDKATVPELPVRPKRVFIVVVSTAVSFFLIGFFIIAREYINSQQKQGTLSDLP